MLARGDVAIFDPTWKFGEGSIGTLVQRITTHRIERPDPRWTARARVVRRQVWSNEARATTHVERTKHDATDAVQQARAEAHQAGLERGDHGHRGGARPQLDGHARERLHLGVPAGVVGRARDLGNTLGDDLVVEPDHRTDREPAASFVGERELDRAVEHDPVEIVSGVHGRSAALSSRSRGCVKLYRPSDHARELRTG